MEIVETEALISQDDALKHYLDSLLSSSGGEVPAVNNPDDVVMRRQVSNALYDDVNHESEKTEKRIPPPKWANNFFSCLPILVGSLTLLIPLKQIRTVIPIRQEIVPTADMPEWVTGTISSFSQKLTVVDLAKVLDETGNSSSDNAISQLVLTNTGTLGLGCHEVSKLQQLSENDVEWRAKNAKHRWIAGVSKKHQLVIVDTRRIEFSLAMGARLV